MDGGNGFVADIFRRCTLACVTDEIVFVFARKLQTLLWMSVDFVASRRGTATSKKFIPLPPLLSFSRESHGHPLKSAGTSHELEYQANLFSLGLKILLLHALRAKTAPENAIFRQNNWKNLREGAKPPPQTPPTLIRQTWKWHGAIWMHSPPQRKSLLRIWWQQRWRGLPTTNFNYKSQGKPKFWGVRTPTTPTMGVPLAWAASRRLFVR